MCLLPGESPDCEKKIRFRVGILIEMLIFAPT